VSGTNTARDLALDNYHSRETTNRPYGIGVVVDPGEKIWAEIPGQTKPRLAR
jgi:hypothetical protein